MNYMDWAAMGAASSAYAEASRARAEVAALWEENQRLREDIDSQKYKQDFQQWVEELIYQFAKTVKAITDIPGEPVNDFMDIASFSYLIEEKKLDTSLISGFEHKEKFEETLLRAQKLLNNLETNQEVHKYIREQEAAQRLRAEKAAKAVSVARKGRLIAWLMFGLSLLLLIMSMSVSSVSGVFASVAGMALSLGLLYVSCPT